MNRVIGMGTGRCGTVTFTKLINMQDSFRATHETFHGVASWRFSDLYFDKLENYIVKGFSDVSLYNLPYVDNLIKFFPTLKFVCLKRDKDETVQSYINKTSENSKGNARNHWTNRASIHWEGYDWRIDPVWDKCYPKFSLPKIDAIRSYWDLYYEKSEFLEKKYPNSFKVFDMNYVLNQREGQSELLSFMGINEVDKKFLLKEKMNIGQKD